MFSDENFSETSEEKMLRYEKELGKEERFLSYSLLPEEQQLLEQKKEIIRSEFKKYINVELNKSYESYLNIIIECVRKLYDKDPISKRAFIEVEKERKACFSEPVNPQLEKEKENIRRYFAGPHLQTLEERTQAIQTLKDIYTGIQKEAFEYVATEMNLFHLLQ